MSSSSSEAPNTPSSSIQTGLDVTVKLPPIVERLKNTSPNNTNHKLPVTVIVVGMAGSGKTTLLTQLQRYLEDTYDQEQEEKQQEQQKLKEEQQEQQKQKSETPPDTDNDDNDIIDDEDDFLPAYCVNLDPATLGETAYDVSIDIRDTVNYKQVMEQHQLGPNGAIMTSLNLFATKFDQVLHILEQRAFGTKNTTVTQESVNATDNTDLSSSSPPIHNQHKPTMNYILVDTPGQIEAFTWSASGQIISEALASSFPTCLCFVVDTVRCAASPNTFMSNMLYACSMLYRTRLPLVVCFNKIDVVSHDFCLDWMRDYEAFQQALDDHAASSGFYGSLTRSLSLVLDEFYANFANAVGVSAVTGEGLPEFCAILQKAATVDFQDYVENLQARAEEQHAKQRAIAASQVRRMQRDIAESSQT